MAPSDPQRTVCKLGNYETIEKVKALNQNVGRALGTVVGIAFIGIGILVLAYPVSFSPLPDWAHSAIFLFLGVALFSYGVAGRSRMFEQFRRSSD